MVNGECTTTSYSINDGPNDKGGDFECNICLELAHDPIVTLCGHLFCWPCLYRWLHHHSLSQECPVCKALVQEDKLVPLYGRGRNQTDPRSKTYPCMTIPKRLAGQRPESASPPQPETSSNFFNYGIRLWPSLINIQFHGYPDADAMLYGYPWLVGYHEGAVHAVPTHGQGHNNQPSMVRGDLRRIAATHLFLHIGFGVITYLLS